MAARIVKCQIVTPQGPALDVDARSVILPAHDGLIGVLPGHAPLVAQLAPGIVRYTDRENRQGLLFIDGGFARIADDEMLILTEEVVTRDQAAVAYPQQQLLEARTLPSQTPEEFEARNRALHRARQLVALTEMH